MSVLDVISRLPEIPVVRDRARAIAVLDAIVSPTRDFRYFWFNSRWSPTEELASMSNGSGDDYSIVFSPAGACALGFDHESSMSPYRVRPAAPWPGLFDGLPEAFRRYVTDPAFIDETGTPVTTVCFWREPGASGWETGRAEDPADDGGAEELFAVLTAGHPEAYQRFAEDIYEIAADIEAIRHVYAMQPLTQSVVSALHPDATLADLHEDLTRIGYPGTS
ncbi:hypothetical protein [Pseudonocardia sp. TRM90224]|uniref:hypothetical protein n=1 Tax=Pseudonocardia sp. TRM90224 TaxID=2812678 RepID=UPI001E46F013|nr:hypothetical protein [Pseudonocardia sp. TRM90224]